MLQCSCHKLHVGDAFSAASEETLVIVVGWERPTLEEELSHSHVNVVNSVSPVF